MGKRFNNFLGLPNISINEADVLIFSVPLEINTTYGHGTKYGPRAILNASCQIEFYDQEIGDELQTFVKIATLKPMSIKSKELVSFYESRYNHKFPIFLGGEHSITPFLIKPFLDRFSNLTVLQVDAHTDLRDKWEGEANSHACAMRRVQELGVQKIVQVGIRSSSLEEQKYINPQNIFWGDQFDVNNVLKCLDENVYLTFDVDGLDASIMPATGTPEPGGISYNKALELLKAVALQKNLIGADFVEFSPIKGIIAYDFLVAKLIYKLICFKAKTLLKQH